MKLTVISPERRPTDIHKPELTCPQCGGRTIFFNGELVPAFFCLSDVPMCNFYAVPDFEQDREKMKQLTGVTLRDRDAEGQGGNMKMIIAPLWETADLDDIRDFLVAPTRQGRMSVEQVRTMDEQLLRRVAELAGDGFVNWMALKRIDDGDTLQGP